MSAHGLENAVGEAERIRLDIAVSPAAGTAAPRARGTVARAIRAAQGVAGPVAGSIGVLLTDDTAIRGLNRQWRGIDKATNVLAFPAAVAPRVGSRLASRHLGDIAISCETAAREARADARPFAHHLAHLAVHGFLHLLGHDHQSNRAAEEMEALERSILARLGIPDPYRT